MKNQLAIAFLVLAFTFTSPDSLSAQENENEDTQWSLFWSGSLDLGSDIFNRSKFTALGVGIKANRTFNNGLGLEAKLSYRNWSDLKRTVVPFFVGPTYTLASNDKTNLLIRAGVGPEAILGNDYSSVFFGYELGPELQIKVGNGHGI